MVTRSHGPRLLLSAALASVILAGVLLSAVPALAESKPAEPTEKELAQQAATFSKRAAELERRDKKRIAKGTLAPLDQELRQVAQALKKKGTTNAQRILARAALRLELARQQLAMARLQQEIAALTAELARVRKRAAEGKQALQDRDQYLQLLKATR